MEEIDRPFNKKLEVLESELQKQIDSLEDKLEAQEDSVEVFNSDVDSLRTDLSEEFSSFQSSIIEQFTEASIPVAGVHAAQDLTEPGRPEGGGGRAGQGQLKLISYQSL